METTALGAALRAGLTAALTSRIGYEQLTRRPRKSSLTLRTSGTANPSVVLYKNAHHHLPKRHRAPAPGTAAGSSSSARASSSHRAAVNAAQAKQAQCYHPTCLPPPKELL